MNFFDSDDFYASNDEQKSESLSVRESYPSSLASTPSDFDENYANNYRSKTEDELLYAIFNCFEEMDLDLVFENFEELKVIEFFWIAKMCLKTFKTNEVVNLIDKVGKKMMFFSTRVNIEVIFWLTDWLKQTSTENKSILSKLFVNENIMDAIRILLSTTCHLTIRSALDFIHLVGVHLGSGFAKMTMAHKLGSKIAWIAEKMYPLDYLSSPSLGKHDKVIEQRLRCDFRTSDFRTDCEFLNRTHQVAKTVQKLFK